MAERIFISYRRDDSAGHAGRVFDRLKGDFGQDVLFMDVDAIPLGANFVRVLRDEVAKCSVLLAIVGPNWLNAKNEDGVRRLDNPNDFVRVEIAAALQRDIPVIPILLEGASIPKAHMLPDDLKELSERHGLNVRHASFHADMDKLVRGLRLTSKAPPQVPIPTTSRGYVSPIPPVAEVIRAQSQVPIRATSTGYPSPLTSVAEVIAARGRWVRDFMVDPRAVVAPEIFEHLFVNISATAGTILRGAQWDGTHYPLWSVIHGYCDQKGWNCVSLDWVTYLGPTWKPEYALLSDAVFKKIGGKPLEWFVKHP